MSKIEQFSRLLHHRITVGGQVFTVPTSNDHTDDTWLNTDLYIGEIGINVTSNTAYMRTNNGIIQLATGTSSSGSTSSTAGLWDYTGTAIRIGSTYSITDVSPRSGYFTDLGSTTLPWMAFGYNLSITPLQTLMLYNAVANNGIMRNPY